MPRVQLSPGPTLRDNGPAPVFLSAPDVGAPARQLAQATGAAADVIDRKVQRDAETRAFQIDSQITSDWLTFDADARTKYRGTNVDQYAPAAEKFWQDAAETYGKDLDPLARQIIGRSLQAKKLNAMAGGLRFVEGERERNFDNAAQASKTTEIQLGITNGDVTSARERVRQINGAVAARKGWTPEMLAAENLRDLSTLHYAHIAKLAEGDAAGAKAYYTENKAEIDGTRQAAIEKVLKAEADNQFAEQFAAQHATLPLDQQLAKAGEIKDPEQREKAITRVRQNNALVREAQAQREAQFADQAWQLVGQGKRVPEALLLQMDGRARVQLQDYLKEKAQKGPAPVKTDPAVHAALWEQLTRDPEAFKKERLIAYGTKLSKEDLEQLYAKQRELLNPKEGKEVITFQNRLTARLEQLGINSGSGDEKKRGLFRAAAQSAMDEYTARTGKKPDDKTETEILDRLMIENDSWFGPSRYYETTPDQRANFQPKISDAERASIVDAFKKRGVAKPSDDQILKAYKALKGI